MSCHYLYVSGDQSGVGKSSISLSLLSLLQRRYQPSELAYIKPCTQCEDIGLIAKYCHMKQIDCVPIGPVVFYKGFTQDCIDQQIKEKQSINQSHSQSDSQSSESMTQSTNQTISPSIAKRHASIVAAVTKLSHNKKFVLVDGVGYPSVGSVCGVSNAHIARLLDCPVVLVSRAGVGNAIDATNYMRDYFHHNHCNVVGVVFNKLPIDQTNTLSINQSINQSINESTDQSTARHTAAGIKDYTTKYFSQIANPPLSVYGHLPMIQVINQSTNETVPAAERVCMLRPDAVDLEPNEDDIARINAFVTGAEQHIDFDAIMKDVDSHYTTREQQ